MVIDIAIGIVFVFSFGKADNTDGINDIGQNITTALMEFAI